MAKRQAAPRSAAPPPAAGQPAALLWLALCAFLSGAGSLMLETVWSRRLELVFGSTTLATSTVLAAYMLGLGLGGLLGGRIADRLRRGARGYGLIEFGIAAMAVLVPVVLMALPAAQRALIDLPFWGAALARFVLCLAVMLLPTLLMGATLPILVVTARRLAPSLHDPAGLLYGVNTLGAVGGTLAVTFLVLPSWGQFRANLLGAGLDVLAGLLALGLVAPHEPVAPLAALQRGFGSIWRELRGAIGAIRAIPALVGSYGVIGAISLACEVAWSRTLTLALGSSVYAFATMLAAFLLGIALGSLLVRRWLPTRLDPGVVYGVGAALLGIFTLTTYWLLQRTPDMVLWQFQRFGTGARSVALGSLLLSLVVMLLPTLVLGGLFPVLVRALVARGQDEGSAVGSLYFANTLGSACGAFVAGFVLIPRLGLASTMTWCAVLALVLAATVTLHRARRWSLACAALAIACALLPASWDQRALTRGVFYRPQKFMTFGLEPTRLDGQPQHELLLYRDGLSATVSVHQEGVERDLRVNGKPDASLGDMPTQALIAHLPMVFTPHAREVAVIGLASGATAGTAALYALERIDVIEIEPAMLAAARHFDDVNHRPLDSSRVRVILDDGRHHLEAREAAYDVIISEPSNPIVAGCANLFTREYYRAAHRALRPGGRLVVWLQLYSTDVESVASVLAALTPEFGQVYGFSYGARWPDLILIATDTPLTTGDLRRYAELPEPARLDLARLSVNHWADLGAQLRLMPDDLIGWARTTRKINTDDSMYVELRAPWLLGHENNAVLDAIGQTAGAIWNLPAGVGGPLSAEELAQLAWSTTMLRGELPHARRLIDAAAARGGSPAATALAGLLSSTERGRPEQFGPLLDQARQAAPDDWMVRGARARVLMQLQQPAEALPHVESALATTTDPTRERRLRQQVLTALQRWEDALADAQQLLAAPAGRFDQPLWGEAGLLATRCKRWPLAIEQLERYLQAEPYAQDCWTALAIAYDATGRPNDAARARRNHDLAVANQQLLVHRRARRVARFGAKADAIDILRELLRVHPGYRAGADDLARLERGESIGP